MIIITIIMIIITTTTIRITIIIIIIIMMKTIKAFSRYIQLKDLVYYRNKVDGKPS